MSEHAILLVTPSRDVAEPFQKASNILGARLRRVTTAAGAIDYLVEQPVSLIVVEQDLPDQDGINLLQETIDIRPFAQRALIMDPTTDATVAVEALNQAKVSLLLDKPLDAEHVTQHLTQTLSGYQLADQGELPTRLKKGMTESATANLERLCTIGEIASSLVHQFNNTLTIMMGHLELLSMDMEDGEQQHRLETLLQAASDGMQLTRNLQAFVREDSEKHQPFDLNKLINDTLTMTEPVWNAGRMRGTICIEKQLGEDIPKVKGHSAEIREALTNLILNALDAMPEGGQLTIRTRHENNAIHLEISDTGIGIPEDLQPRVFEPFFTTKGNQGNGMGLGIVRKTIEDHGGSIHLESRPGKGTTFLLLLPLDQASSQFNVIPLFNTPSEKEIASFP